MALFKSLAHSSSGIILKYGYLGTSYLHLDVDIFRLLVVLPLMLMEAV